MVELRYTLLSDGSSDKALTYILSWLLQQILPNCAIQPQWGDLRRLRHPPSGLPERIKLALQLYPCDLLFVHRDAERELPAQRRDEIGRAVAEAATLCVEVPRWLCVVPVRMTEAWLLIEPKAIRRAAGNPNGGGPLDLPRTRDLEDIPNPKKMLRERLCIASEFKGRRLSHFKRRLSPSQVARFIDDFSPLRELGAFQALEEDVRSGVAPAT